MRGGECLVVGSRLRYVGQTYMTTELRARISSRWKRIANMMMRTRYDLLAPRLLEAGTQTRPRTCFRVYHPRASIGWRYTQHFPAFHAASSHGNSLLVDESRLCCVRGGPLFVQGRRGDASGRDRVSQGQLRNRVRAPPRGRQVRKESVTFFEVHCLFSIHRAPSR